MSLPFKKCKSCDYYTRAKGRYHEYCWGHNLNIGFVEVYHKVCHKWKLTERLDEILDLKEPIHRWDW